MTDLREKVAKAMQRGVMVTCGVDPEIQTWEKSHAKDLYFAQADIALALIRPAVLREAEEVVRNRLPGPIPQHLPLEDQREIEGRRHGLNHAIADLRALAEASTPQREGGE